MAPSNLAVLTKSHGIIASKKRAKKEQIKEVLFDEKARREFLTGFHKRKVQKKEAAKAKAQQREKEERLEARREQRQMLAEKAKQNAAQVEAAYGAVLEDDESDDEWSGVGPSSSSKGKQRAEKEEEFEDEEQLATVTVVEDFDPDELIHGPSKADDMELDMPSERHALPQPPAKTKPAVEAKKVQSKTTTKAKKIKYQTNAARKSERSKQLKRKVEKAERAGGKASRRKGGKR